MALSRKYRVLMNCAPREAEGPVWQSAWDVYKRSLMMERLFDEQLETLEEEGLIETQIVPGPLDHPDDVDVKIRMTETGWHRFCSIRDLLSRSKKHQMQTAD